jgi:hypothetical protein
MGQHHSAAAANQETINNPLHSQRNHAKLASSSGIKKSSSVSDFGGPDASSRDASATSNQGEEKYKRDQMRCSKCKTDEALGGIGQSPSLCKHQ